MLLGILGAAVLFAASTWLAQRGHHHGSCGACPTRDECGAGSRACDTIKPESAR
jgi:hypothetical protein